MISASRSKASTADSAKLETRSTPPWRRVVWSVCDAGEQVERDVVDAHDGWIEARNAGRPRRRHAAERKEHESGCEAEREALTEERDRSRSDVGQQEAGFPGDPVTARASGSPKNPTAADVPSTERVALAPCGVRAEVWVTASAKNNAAAGYARVMPLIVGEGRGGRLRKCSASLRGRTFRPATVAGCPSLRALHDSDRNRAACSDP